MVLKGLNKYLLILITLLFLSNIDLLGSNAGKILKVLKKELNCSEIVLSDFLEDEIVNEPKCHVYQVALNGEVIGYAINAVGFGRYDEYEFLVYTDLLKRIEFVRVINYYSDYGGEISSKKWLDQFSGYEGGHIKYGEDIQAISGATISGNSMVNRITEIISMLKESDI